MTRNFAGIPEDTKENIGIERRFGGLVHIRGLAQQYKGESESWWLLLRCEARCMKSAAHWIPVPGHPMHSSNTSFLFLSSFLIPICSSISVDGIPFSQCQNLEKGIIHHGFIYLSFFHLNRSLIIVALTSLVFTEYVSSSPFLLCILLSFPVQMANCLQTCPSQIPPTLLPE